MNNYIKEYLNTVIKSYKPNNTFTVDGIKPLRYVRGEYMLSIDIERRMIKDVGSDAYTLYKYFYDTSAQSKRNLPTDDKGIGALYGWSASKTARLKTKLKEHKYLLILKESTNKGTTLFKVLLNPNIINQYIETGTVPDNVKVTVANDE